MVTDIGNYGENMGKDKLGDWAQQIHTIIYKTDN